MIRDSRNALRSLVNAGHEPDALTAQLGWDVSAILAGLTPDSPELREDVTTLRDWLGVTPSTGPVALDESSVARMVDGRPPAYTTAVERVAAVRILVGQGMSDRQIAARIGVTGRTVLRIRQRHGIPAAIPSNNLAVAP